MRVLGVDFGLQRIGLAVAETEFGVVTPRPPIQASGTLKKDAEAIAKIAKNEMAERVVLGLPLAEDANDGGRMQRICRTMAENIAALGLPTELVDEALTSVAAESAMAATGMKASQRKKRRDGEAAAQILERYMGALGG